MKKNIIKYIILPCVSMALVFLLFPFRVFADNPTYTVVSGDCFLAADGYGGFSNYHYFVTIRNNSSEVRLVCLGNTSIVNIYLVSENPFQYEIHNGVSSCSVISLNNADSYRGYYFSNTVSFYTERYSPVDGVYVVNASRDIDNALYYSFGNGAVEPEPPAPSYGQLIDVSFGTSIAGSGDASGNNLDRIEWNTLKDSNDNDLPSGSTVSIRAVPGKYTGTNKENLLTKLYTDFVLDTANATVLDTVSAYAGSYQTTWRNVANHFTWPFASVTSCLQGESYWYKNGWIYQVRLNIDDYHSEWMTIYNATSSGVKNSETIINNTSITAISESVNNINNINQTTNNYYVSNSSDTTNNYYYYGSPVNPDYSGNDVSGLFPSISEILNAIRNLPSAIGQLLHNLFDDLFGIDWEYDDFEQQKQYVIANSGAFGECIGHLDELKTLIMSYNTATGLAIIQWGDVVIDDTVIVPAGLFNLGEIIAEDPMRSFYTLYQSLFSGFLYTLTFIKIYREALKALRR